MMRGWLFGLLLWACTCTGWAAEAPLRAGVLEEAPPFLMQTGLGHQPRGFVIDLFNAIAARMQRHIIYVTVPPEALNQALADGRVDVLPGPLAASPERAAGLLLTEGYMWGEFQFGARANEPVRSLQDLRGRRLAVRQGSLYAAWAQRNAAKYGFSIVTAGNAVAAAEAVLHKKADASLGASPVQAYMAAHNRAYSAGLSLPETRTHLVAAVAKTNVELRDALEDALRCLKQNGTVAKISKRWFGQAPDQEDLENLLVPGYGVPGLEGFDPKPHKTRC